MGKVLIVILLFFIGLLLYGAFVDPNALTVAKNIVHGIASLVGNLTK